LASLSIALYEAYLFVKNKNGVDGQALAVKRGCARDSRGGAPLKECISGRVARGSGALDGGSGHSRRVEEAQEEGVDPEEETQHGDRPLCSRDWRGLSFFFVARPEFKKAQTEKGWVRTGGKGRISRYFYFPGVW
jgi:hypothetical protein